jgi:hypothetical protein
VPASAESHARKVTGSNHQAEKPNRNSARSDTLAPSRPTLLRMGSPLPEVLKAASPAWCVTMASRNSSQAKAPAISSAFWRQREGAAEPGAAIAAAPSPFREPSGKLMTGILADHRATKRFSRSAAAVP